MCNGLLQLAERAGAIVHAETPVLGFKAENGGFEIETARGKVQADHVIVGTNGYTDGVDPWLRRRLVPVRSRIIATAPLSNNLMSELMPKGVMCSRRANFTTTIGRPRTAGAYCLAVAMAR
jgi:glycine/D-amino acid oxidase-like deaminating enzyme